MMFSDKGNVKTIIFEDTDTDTEKRIVEQALALIRNLLIRFNEVKP